MLKPMTFLHQTRVSHPQSQLALGLQIRTEWQRSPSFDQTQNSETGKRDHNSAILILFNSKSKSVHPSNPATIYRLYVRQRYLLHCVVPDLVHSYAPVPSSAKFCTSSQPWLHIPRILAFGTGFQKPFCS